MKYLVVFGPPGVGKGTQATKLAKLYGIPHISTGEIIRDNIRQRTPLGLQAEAIINQGHLLSNAIMIDLMANRIAQPDCHFGYILDGFPRTVIQAEALDIMQPERLIIISLNAPDSVLIERILDRGKLFGRADDTKEVVVERLKVYQKQTAPVLEYYYNSKKNVKISIDGWGSVEEVFNACVDAIEALGV